MECLIGIQFNDFVILAADMTHAHSIIVMKKDEDKMYNLSNNLVMAVCGESGDTTQFAEYIAKNIQLYKMKNGYELSPDAAANFTRRNLAESLRSRNHYLVNLLLAGYDKHNGSELYFLDYLASMVKLPYAAHGYGAYFILGILDKYYRSNMSEQEGYDLLQMCINEVHKRFIVNLPVFKVRIVDSKGIRDLASIGKEAERPPALQVRPSSSVFT